MTQKQLNELLQDMSLEEKVGQMIQLPAEILTGGGLVTGPTGTTQLTQEQVGMAGSVLGIKGAEKIRELQRQQMEKQPHHIPLLFMLDVINGFETIFPIPLALGCTFSPEMAEEACSVAAAEAASEGLHVTFSPMLDLVHDARWGRVMESPGEDPYLNSEMARAMVRGYQGELHAKDKLAACLKHFAGYGAPEGGRDYDNVELSERTLMEDYLPAYEAAVKEGCRMAMTSFNTLDRIPSSGNKRLLRKILREKMGFDGVVISDYSAVEEMVFHGIAADAREAAKLAAEAGVDIDMVSNAYAGHLAELVRSGEVSEKLVDEAVLRILTLKNDLGLFEDPFRGVDPAEAEKTLLRADFRQKARETAAASFVLLKNEGILPLRKSFRNVAGAEQKGACGEGEEKSARLCVGTEEKQKSPGLEREEVKEFCSETEEGRKDSCAEKNVASAAGSIAWIGPYVDNREIYGAWSFPERPEETVTVRQGVEAKGVPGMAFAQGCYLMDKGCATKYGSVLNPSDEQADRWMEEALKLAASSDRVVLCLGEHRDLSGEAGSRTNLSISEGQMELLRKVHQVNPNIVTVLFSGRPLAVKEIAELSKALLAVWMPGTEGGNAIADVLFGDRVPQGKLSMTFPRALGQAPIYYNHLATGRPNSPNEIHIFKNGYLDEVTAPLYPFGYGLSYTKFAYSKVKLDRREMTAKERITASVTVTNTGRVSGVETVQLYLKDRSASVARPVRSLKGFQKVSLAPGESREVRFTIEEPMLRFYDIDMNYVSEPGSFEVYIGESSDTANGAEFVLT